MFSSPYLDWTIERIALNAKVVGGPHGDKDKMVAAASGSRIVLWSIQDGGSGNEIGRYYQKWVQAKEKYLTSELQGKPKSLVLDLTSTVHLLLQVYSVLAFLLTTSSSLGTSWWLQVTQERSECGTPSHNTGR